MPSHDEHFMTSDILAPVLKIKEKHFVGVSRICVIVTGIVSLIIALKLQGIIASLLLAYTVYSAGLVIPILLGFYADRFRINAAGAIIAIIGGGASGLFLKLAGHESLLLCTIPLSAVLTSRTICGRKQQDEKVSRHEQRWILVNNARSRESARRDLLGASR
jgi:Na+/proline symporter